MSGCAPRVVVFLGLLAACGKPVDRSGNEDASFTKASMGLPTEPSADPDRPLAADLAVLPVSMVVSFNRLQTPEKLQDFLNRKPGQFSHIDLDKDGAPDPLTVVARDSADSRGFEIRVHPNTGEFVVATMMFDKDWEFLGHYSGVLGGGASTVSHPLPVAAPSPALPTISPTPTVSAGPGTAGAAAGTAGAAVGTAGAAAGTASAPAPGAVAGAQAVAAGRDVEGGVAASVAR